MKIIIIHNWVELHELRVGKYYRLIKWITNLGNATDINTLKGRTFMVVNPVHPLVRGIGWYRKPVLVLIDIATGRTLGTLEGERALFEQVTL